MREVIILAGGLGTRLRTTIPDLPKCLAPVNGKPFLHYVISYLQSQGIEHFIFSLGYKKILIQNFLLDTLNLSSFDIISEDEPLGTGGAIKLSCAAAKEENIIVMNGDTLYKSDLQKLYAFHKEMNAECTLTLKPMKNFDRYGVVTLGQNGLVENFEEKKFYEEGLINGGVYALNVQQYLNKEFPMKFSFEKDYLETYYSEQKIFGIKDEGYFIDIGIPEDYERAQTEFKTA
ncbi:MAG: nucleotidyltransferase [Chitinophagaceae bacterium]|nr:nucleotidyltransferase [Chitinophagaceae bacterium]